ncbi:MAG TPA: TatD family hydrolase [Chlamydiales bacterium]|nr:TatD family hydrolase [Chlamydiales bacterium]
MRFIDSHAHLTDPLVLPQLPAILERAKKASISHILNICTDEATLREGLRWAALDPAICNAGATTPHDVEALGEKEFSLFADAARSKKLVAIGETGLDYYYKELPKDLQKSFLIRYLHLAMECSLPVIFHCREAFADLFSIVDAEYKGRAILHCFTGSMKEAEEVLKRGWYLSLSGIVTFKKSLELQEVAKKVPLSHLLIETDTPFLAPQSHRGKPNEPSFLPETAMRIAELKGISLEKVAFATSENAKKLFYDAPDLA